MGGFFKKSDARKGHKLTKGDIYYGRGQEDEVIVLVPGLGRDPESLKHLAQTMYRKYGYACYVLNHPNTKQSLEQSARFIQEKIDFYGLEGGFDKMHFIGASRGGLVTRKMFELKKPKNLGRIVCLGTPHHGSELANHFLEKNIIGFLSKMVSGPSMKQMQTGPQGMQKTFPFNRIPDGLDYGVIAAQASLNEKDRRETPLHPLESPIPYPHDGVASVASTRIEGMKDHIVLKNALHIDLEVHRETPRLCHEFLQNAKFNHPADHSKGVMVHRARENPFYFKLISIFYKPKA